MENKQDTTLREMQARIKQVCEERGWDRNSHLEIFLLFTEEIGELANAIRKVTLLHAQEAALTEEEMFNNKKQMEDEFADVLNYLLDLANFFDVDLQNAFWDKDKKNSLREWQ
jgi:NTP pyrophosphatase (non-canonical NTP hydrolase)